MSNAAKACAIVPGGGAATAHAAGCLDIVCSSGLFDIQKFLTNSAGGPTLVALVAGLVSGKGTQGLIDCWQHFVKYFSSNSLYGVTKSIFPFTPHTILMDIHDAGIEAARISTFHLQDPSFDHLRPDGPLLKILLDANPSLFPLLPKDSPEVIIGRVRRDTGEQETILLNRLDCRDMMLRHLAASGNLKCFSPFYIEKNGPAYFDGGYKGTPRFHETVEDCARNNMAILYFPPYPLDARWLNQHVPGSDNNVRATMHAHTLWEIEYIKERCPDLLWLFVPPNTDRHLKPSELNFSPRDISENFKLGQETAIAVLNKQYQHTININTSRGTIKFTETPAETPARPLLAASFPFNALLHLLHPQGVTP